MVQNTPQNRVNVVTKSVLMVSISKQRGSLFHKKNLNINKTNSKILRRTQKLNDRKQKVVIYIIMDAKKKFVAF